MKFDHDILFDFLSDEDKKSFMVWDNAIVNITGDTIIATYRAPFESRIHISLDEYQMKVKEKERDNKLNDLGIC